MKAGQSDAVYTAYIGLGANIGDREKYLQDALRSLEERKDIQITGLSRIYETEPVGMVDQASFLNMAAELRTSLTAMELLRAMLDVELSLGRTRVIHWGPRTIDLDLLLYGDMVIEENELVVPHPRMLERAFVLIPLVDLLMVRSPERANQFKEQLERVDGKEGVRLWSSIILK